MDVPVKAEAKILLKKRITTFLGCCPLRVLFEDGNQGLIGRGSGQLLTRFEIISGQKSAFPVIEVGNYCESSVCHIQIGGEHPNDQIFNNSLSSVPLLRSFLQSNKVDSYQASHPHRTVIGHGVVLSKCVFHAQLDSDSTTTWTPIGEGFGWSLIDCAACG